MDLVKEYYTVKNRDKLVDLTFNYKINKDKFLRDEKDLKKLHSLLFYKRRDVVILEEYIKDLENSIDKPDFEYEIKFGHYKGKKLKDLDKEYINYLKNVNLQDKILKKYIDLL